jgi:hypothetical protein
MDRLTAAGVGAVLTQMDLAQDDEPVLSTILPN